MYSTFYKKDFCLWSHRYHKSIVFWKVQQIKKKPQSYKLKISTVCALNFHMNRIVKALIQTLFTTLIVKYTMSSITGFVILLSKLNGYDKKKNSTESKTITKFYTNW